MPVDITAGAAHGAGHDAGTRRSAQSTAVGALLYGLTQVYFLFAVVLPTIKGGDKAAANPWDGADGLEWTVPSPAPFHTFDVPPVIKLRQLM